MSEQGYRNGAVAILPILPDAYVGIEWTPGIPGLRVAVSGPDWIGGREMVMDSLTMPQAGTEPLLTRALVSVLMAEPQRRVFAAMILESVGTDLWEWFPPSVPDRETRTRLGMR